MNRTVLNPLAVALLLAASPALAPPDWAEEIERVYRSGDLSLETAPARLVSLRALFRWTPDAAASFRVARLALEHEPEANLRYYAATHLGRIGSEGDPRETQLALSRAAESDPSARVRRRAVLSIAKRVREGGPGEREGLEALLRLARSEHALYLESVLVRSLNLLAPHSREAEEALRRVAEGGDGISPRVAELARLAREKGPCPLEVEAESSPEPAED